MQVYLNINAVLALREVWEFLTPKIALGLSKIIARKSVTRNFSYLVIYKKNLELINVLFSLRIAVLLHK